MMYQLDEPCIVAPGKAMHDGYHRCRIGNRRVIRAHILAYTAIYGPPPLNKPFVLHKCNNRECWNPSHLYAGTQKDNVRDAVKSNTHRESRKTHCPKGHELSGDNLVGTMFRRGWRKCKICHNKRTCERIKTLRKNLEVPYAR